VENRTSELKDIIDSKGKTEEYRTESQKEYAKTPQIHPKSKPVRHGH
jgi:hypothetical protein